MRETLEIQMTHHGLKEPLTRAIETAVADKELAETITDRVMRELGLLGVISYSAPDSLKLLTPAGRVLVSLMERPGMTMRELSVYMGTTEANVLKQVTALVKAGVIARTKWKGRNSYCLNLNEALGEPDITRLYAAICVALHQPPKTTE